MIREFLAFEGVEKQNSIDINSSVILSPKSQVIMQELKEFI